MENDDYFVEDKFSVTKAIFGLVTFSTILPINVFTSIEYMTRLTWIWPFIHLVIGMLGAALGFICLNFLHLNVFLSASIVYGFLMIITGYNHLDGVMDMADGVMVHGSSEKKISVMKDSSVGAGGVSTLFLVAIITVASLTNILDYKFFYGIILCEMLAKTSLLTTALMSRPLPSGIGRYFITSTNKVNYIISTVIVAVIAFMLGKFVGLAGLLGAIFAGFLIALIARKNFVFANGDVLGMSNEVGRLFALIFMVIILFFIS